MVPKTRNQANGNNSVAFGGEKNISLYPLGGIYNPLRIKAYGIKGFSGVRLFNKKIT